MKTLQEAAAEIIKESNEWFDAESQTKYLNINVTKEEIKRNPDIVRLVAEDGECIEYAKLVN